MKRSSARRGMVLDQLHKAKGGYISGEDLSHKIGVSRTSIWKYIKYLREAGYKIESSSKLGYRLTKASKNLIPEEIKRNLSTDFIGHNIICYSNIDSTNKVAKIKAQGGEEEGTIFIAEKQSVAKGRLGRDFSSPLGGLWLSIILRPNIKPMYSTRLTYISSLAVVKTINELTDLGAKIKWPNDILISDKKVCGILTQMSAELDRVDYLVVGIGVNLNFPLEDLDKSLHKKATTIYQELGEEIDRLEFLHLLLDNFEGLYKRLDNFETILDEWKDYSYTMERQVKVDNGREVIEGKAIDIGDDGALIIQVGSEKRRVYSGEVFLSHQDISSGN